MVSSIACHAIEHNELVSELPTGAVNNELSIGNLLPDTIQLGTEAIQLRQVVSASIEGIADPLDLVSNVLSFPEHDDVNRSLSSCLIFHVRVLFDVDEGLALGLSEDQLLQPSDVFLIDYACNMVDLNRANKPNSVIKSSSFEITACYLWHALLYLRKHFLRNRDHLKLVFKLPQRSHSLLKLPILPSYKFFGMRDFSRNFLQKILHRLSL